LVSPRLGRFITMKMDIWTKPCVKAGLALLLGSDFSDGK
jgi:hypothetical protein